MLRRLPAVLLLVASSALAQVSETIEVRVTNVDVVVTDRSGRPVTGLSKDDFRVYENGFEKPITNFSEVRSGEPETSQDIAEERQRRRIVIFVDQDTVDPHRRAAALDALASSLDSLLRDGDEAMVVTFFRSRRAVVNLTTDRETLRAALREAAKQPTGSAFRQASRERIASYAGEIIGYLRDAQEAARAGIMRAAFLTPEEGYRMSIEQAKIYADEIYEAQRRMLTSVQRTIAAMAGMEGKKVFILLAGDLQQRPAADLYGSIDQMFHRIGVSVVDSADATQGADRTLTPLLQAVAREANAHGVTLYVVDASDLRFSRTAESAMTFDALGGAPPSDTNIETATSMVSLAAETGGRALVGSINYSLLVDHLSSDLSSYYSIGYRPDAGSGERGITVRANKPGLRVRARSSYTLKTAEQEANERVVANLFHPLNAGELGIDVRLGHPEADGEHYLLPVAVRFPGDVTTIDDGSGSFTGEFSIYFVTASLAGNVSPVAKDTQPFTYTRARAGTIRSRPITYNGSLRVRAGDQIVSVAVVDRVGGRTGFARATFTAP